VVVTLEDSLRKAPAYPSASRAIQRRRNREAGLGGRGLLDPDEKLGRSNLFFDVKGKELKSVALRYLSLPDASEQTRLKTAMGKFFGEGRAFSGAFVTCSELSCKDVCGKLMECAASVDLKVPSVLESLRQFIVELRRWNADLRRFFLKALLGFRARRVRLGLTDGTGPCGDAHDQKYCVSPVHCHQFTSVPRSHEHSGRASEQVAPLKRTRSYGPPPPPHRHHFSVTGDLHRESFRCAQGSGDGTRGGAAETTAAVERAVFWCARGGCARAGGRAATARD